MFDDVALLAIVGLAATYDTLTFVLGTQFLPLGWLYAVSGVGRLSTLSAAVAGMLHHLGLAVFSAGMAARAITAPLGSVTVIESRQMGAVWLSHEK